MTIPARRDDGGEGAASTTTVTAPRSAGWTLGVPTSDDVGDFAVNGAGVESGYAGDADPTVEESAVADAVLDD